MLYGKKSGCNFPYCRYKKLNKEKSTTKEVFFQKQMDDNYPPRRANPVRRFFVTVIKTVTIFQAIPCIFFVTYHSKECRMKRVIQLEKGKGKRT